MAILIEDIPYNLHQLVEIVGLEKFEEISKLYGGDNLYIPMYSRLSLGARNRKIAKEYNGKNIQNLRRKYNISAQQVKKLLEKEGIK